MKITPATSNTPWFRQEDVGDGLIRTIKTVTKLEIPPRPGSPAVTRWTLLFTDDRRALPLNRTNLLLMAKLYGDDSDDWHGQDVVLYSDPTIMYGGVLRGGIRVRKPTGRGARPSSSRMRPISGALDHDDDRD